MAELSRAYTISPSNDSTVAVDLWRYSLGRCRKDMFYFVAFQGEVIYHPEALASFKMQLEVDAHSVACFRAGLSERGRRAMADSARNVLTANGRGQMSFTANSLRAKPLRGYVIEGVLQVCGISRALKLNAVLSPVRNDILQLDCDAAIRLSDFELPCRSSLFGLFHTKDEATLRLLLWAHPAAQARSTSS